MLVPSPPLSLTTTVRASASLASAARGSHAGRGARRRGAARRRPRGSSRSPATGACRGSAGRPRPRARGPPPRASVPSPRAHRRWSWRHPTMRAWPAIPRSPRVDPPCGRDGASSPRAATRAPTRQPSPSTCSTSSSDLGLGAGAGRHVVRVGARGAAHGGDQRRAGRARHPGPGARSRCPTWTSTGATPSDPRRTRLGLDAVATGRPRPRARASRSTAAGPGWARAAAATTGRCRDGTRASRWSSLLHPGEVLGEDEPPCRGATHDQPVDAVVTADGLVDLGLSRGGGLRHEGQLVAVGLATAFSVNGHGRCRPSTQSSAWSL